VISTLVAGRSSASPADLFGDLLTEVQLRRLHPDGKTFVDAVPLRRTADIMADFERLERSDAAIRSFVSENFRLPSPAAVHSAHGERDLRRYITSIWPELIRAPAVATEDGSLLATDGPYVVPGGRFVEFYYWDSYFSLLGLIRDGHEELAKSIVDNVTSVIEQHGHVPNGTRSYYLGRSQPPLYFAMTQLVPAVTPSAARRRLDAMIAEHRFWMRDAETLAPGQTASRVVRMPDGALLNRYWDDRDTPRDESFYEDVSTASASSQPPASVYRALRAGAESGWDFSSRWCAEGGTLATIRTQHVVPIDLNALLFGLETAIVRASEALYEHDTALRFSKVAKARRLALHRWLWSEDEFFADYDLIENRTRDQLTAATLVPLFTGVATRSQAARIARATDRHLVGPGGLRTTLIETGEQWDWPNGWAPLQWIAFAGLHRYGHRRLADKIARRWVETVDGEFQRSGWIHEKYDVEQRRGGAGGEYAPQLGFGWTNGVTAALIDILRDTSIAPIQINPPQETMR
jgi:alpha,alpha-trehalase